jgi:hypothetical protein
VSLSFALGGTLDEGVRNRSGRSSIAKPTLNKTAGLSRADVTRDGNRIDLSSDNGTNMLPPVYMRPAPPSVKTQPNKQRVAVSTKSIVVPSEGRLKLDCNSTARVTEGGRFLGKTPLDIALPPGEHQFLLENARAKRTLKLTIVDGEVTRHYEQL